MSDTVPWPPHAYVPGQNARHPEGWFDDIKASVASDAAVQDTQAWSVGLKYLQAGYFWECHEVLEAVWLALPDPSPERDVTQAIIQLANARLKHRMGKPNAVLRLCDMVDALLKGHAGTMLGLDVQMIASWVHQTRVTISK
ncbi:DUF309 domain-containing protein [Ascidiaceihabitans donghaensis]|uniref:DUF309 domain-containing protein n=1 Tax=Ascidiaceihabitans donghaensis TaxID=1510460 RepID=UPI000D550AB1|nr:DUF309 domain-containing protein [Ascidiaceihabitans donghaensis]